jgi:hypothetical protein
MTIGRKVRAPSSAGSVGRIGSVAITSTIQPDGIMRSLRATALAARASFSRGQNSTAADQLQALEQQISTDAPSWPSVASEQQQLDDMINSILSSLQ